MKTSQITNIIGKLCNEIESSYFFNRRVIPVIGLSGGVDSMVIAHMFYNVQQKNPNFKYVLAHFDHDQGRHDDDCANAAKRYAKRVAKDLEYYKADGLTLLGKEGFENTARYARYAYLYKIAKAENKKFSTFRVNGNTHELGFDNSIIVTGHNLNDQIENILMGICRGTKSSNVAMAKKTIYIAENVEVHRPMLDLSREVILALAKHWNLEWCEDTTNTDQSYERNFFRHAIIPLLKTKRNVLKTIPKSVPTLGYLKIGHENNLFSKANRFIND